MSIGSDTLIRWIWEEGVGVDEVGGGEEGGAGDWRSQPSNIVDKRFCERVARQSPELFLTVVGEEGVGAVGFFFAVPSSSSSSSSSSASSCASCALNARKTRSVLSPGSSSAAAEAADVVRERERRYHSSGTQKRIERVAREVKGLGRVGEASMSDNIAFGARRVHSAKNAR